MREAAQEHAGQRNRPEADPLGNTAIEPVLALVGDGVPLQVKGLNKKTMVPGEGLEPSRPEGPAGLSRLRLPVTPPGRVPQR